MSAYGGAIFSAHVMALFFFFNDTATTEIYTLALHDALPISSRSCRRARLPPKSPPPRGHAGGRERPVERFTLCDAGDRKSTRLNSSHANISYAVFCLKKKTTCLTIHPR